MYASIDKSKYCYLFQVYQRGWIGSPGGTYIDVFLVYYCKRYRPDLLQIIDGQRDSRQSSQGRGWTCDRRHLCRHSHVAQTHLFGRLKHKSCKFTLMHVFAMQYHFLPYNYISSGEHFSRPV